MRWVVFLRAINVGGANRCRPASIAKELARFDVVNIGAVGTFVVREDVPEELLRAAIAKQLPFKVEIMICSARDLLKLWKTDPFTGQPAGPDITHFVSVLGRSLRPRPPIPIILPAEGDWQLKVIGLEGKFLLGLYRRHMKAIDYLGKLEKRLGVPATNRSWKTIEKVVKVLTGH